MSRVRLDVLIVERGLAPSRARARAAIEGGGVAVDGRPASRASDMVDAAAELSVRPPHPWVGRGALKLDHALGLWPVAVEGRVVLDVGASTGGFTEVCLSRGARRVYAVDVGRGQLHPSLTADRRVVDLQTTDARVLDRHLIDEAPEIVVCDASFIGLAKVLPRPLELAAPDADLIALVKPQFEVGPARVGKGGVVADPAAREDAVAAVRGFLEALGWKVREVAQSPITGGDGNIEYLLWARREADTKKPPA
jgi:23S rRNA (cytidine1920-2'-O)/16S rRNA (cytidine1409-2'-O)-methyltransferase